MLFLMVWFPPEQNEVIRSQSQQKSSHEDNRSILRQLEVRPGWGGRDAGVSIVCQVTCQLVLRRRKVSAPGLFTGLGHVLTCPNLLLQAASATDVAAEFCP